MRPASLAGASDSRAADETTLVIIGGSFLSDYRVLRSFRGRCPAGLRGNAHWPRRWICQKRIASMTAKADAQAVFGLDSASPGQPFDGAGSPEASRADQVQVGGPRVAHRLSVLRERGELHGCDCAWQAGGNGLALEGRGRRRPPSG